MLTVLDSLYRSLGTCCVLLLIIFVPIPFFHFLNIKYGSTFSKVSGKFRLSSLVSSPCSKRKHRTSGIDLEIAWTNACFARIIRSWAQKYYQISKVKDLDEALQELIKIYRQYIIAIDYLLPVWYAFGLASVFAVVTQSLAEHLSIRVYLSLLFLFSIPFIAAFFDWMENTFMLTALGGIERIADLGLINNILVRLASIFAYLKFILLIFAIFITVVLGLISLLLYVVASLEALGLNNIFG